MSNRSIKRIVNIPSGCNPASQGGWVHSESFGPFRNTQRFTFVSNKHIASSVPALLLVRRPAAILRRVVAVVIDAVNGVFVGWFAPHVLKEQFKTIPSLAYAYTATTISGISGVVWIIATKAHSAPSYVFSRACFAMRYPITPAGNILTANEVLSNCGELSCAGITDTQPYDGSIWGSPYWSKGKNISECLPSKVFCSFVRLYNSVSHFDTSNIGSGQVAGHFYGPYTDSNMRGVPC